MSKTQRTVREGNLCRQDKRFKGYHTQAKANKGKKSK
jgi:hypothetical protein